MSMLSPLVAEESRHEGLRVHVFPSRCTSATHAYRAALGPRTMIAPPNAPAMVGQGEALTLTGDVQEITRAAKSLGRKAAESAGEMRFLGGLAFDPRAELGGAWRGFPVGHFVCPRLSWRAPSDGHPARIVMVAGAHESRADLEAEVAAFEARAARVALPAAQSVHATLAVAAASSTVLEDIEEETRAAWHRLVTAATQTIRDGALEKVVAARSVRAERVGAFDTAALIDALGETPATRFALDIAGATFLGASPELLVHKSGTAVRTEALAGSEPRTGQSDAQEIERLLASQKDRQEHRFVVRAIEQALGPFMCTLHVPATPQVRTLPTVHHLQRSIEGVLARDVHVLELVSALHPTPAVCGTPRERAREWLREHEGLERGYYAGPVGWFDGHGDGELRVALRSALVRDNQAWLFGGAGLVAASDPEREWVEVEAKLQVMKRALGVAR